MKIFSMLLVYSVSIVSCLVEFSGNVVKCNMGVVKMLWLCLDNVIFFKLL